MSDDHYSDIYTNIRVTDDISFKLLGLVPLLSGSGILVAVMKSESLWSPAIYMISLFGAMVTFGLFRWELRNIQTCMWLRDRAAAIEKTANMGKAGQFYLRPKAPTLWKMVLGKTEAEKLVYSLTTFAWLSLPWMVWSAATAKGQTPLLIPSAGQTSVYIVIAVLIAILTIISFVLPVKANSDIMLADDA